MKEFIEKLIGALEERKEKVLQKENYLFGNIGLASTEGFNRGLKTAISIVNQLAEEYNKKYEPTMDLIEYGVEGYNHHLQEQYKKGYDEGRRSCIKSSCSNCEVYDKEKHYCPKFCDVIKHTTEELAEEQNNDWITDRNPTKEECKNNRFWITDSDRWSYEADFDWECERWRDLETGGFIEVIAWYMLPLPAPYQPKGE